MWSPIAEGIVHCRTIREAIGMTNKLSTSFSVLAKTALAISVVGGLWVQPVWASATDRVADGVNLSGNPFFPLVLNSKWTYDYTTGATSFTSTQTVAGSGSTPTGTQVNVDTTNSVLPGKVVAATYTIGKGGAVEVEGSSGSGSSASSFSTSYWIPTASQIESCSACKFSGPFSASFAGQSMKGTLTEVATALGAHSVTVPAGTFSTEEVKLSVGMHATGAMPMPMTMNMTFHLYLAKNVGMVENSGGSMAMNIMGHTVNTGLGTDKLTSYKV
jgi:hypothetical protein